MNPVYCELKVAKLKKEECNHLILEKEIGYLEGVPVWRCIFCDQIVKLKKIKNEVQKKIQK